jgi:hypothetical protein
MDGNSRHSFQPPILNVLTLFDNADFGTLIRFSSQPSFAPSMSVCSPLLTPVLKMVANDKSAAYSPDIIPPVV